MRIIVKLYLLGSITDEYKDNDGNNVPLPWGLNKLGLCTVMPKWKAAWEVRLDALGDNS